MKRDDDDALETEFLKDNVDDAHNYVNEIKRIYVTWISL